MTHVLMFATLNESKYLLSLLGANVSDPDKKPPYVIETNRKDLLIYVCGMGCAAAEAGTDFAITSLKPSMITNIGICGALSKKISIGDIFRIKKATAWPDLKYIDAFYSGGLLDNIPAADLVTSAEPVFDPDKKSILSQYGHIVDMEGAVIARACTEHNIPCQMIKGVSDLAGKGDRASLLKNIAPVSGKLAEVIMKSLGNFND